MGAKKPIKPKKGNKQQRPQSAASSGAAASDGEDAIDALIQAALNTDPLSLNPQGRARIAGGHKVYDKKSHAMRSDLFRGRFSAFGRGSTVAPYDPAASIASTSS